VYIYRAALFAASLAFNQTPAYTSARPWIWGLVHRAVCLFASQLSLVLIAPTLSGTDQAELIQVAAEDGLLVWRRSPIQVLTGSSVGKEWTN